MPAARGRDTRGRNPRVNRAKREIAVAATCANEQEFNSIFVALQIAGDFCPMCFVMLALLCTFMGDRGARKGMMRVTIMGLPEQSARPDRSKRRFSSDKYY